MKKITLIWLLLCCILFVGCRNQDSSQTGDFYAEELVVAWVGPEMSSEPTVEDWTLVLRSNFEDMSVHVFLRKWMWEKYLKDESDYLPWNKVNFKWVVEVLDWAAWNHYYNVKSVEKLEVVNAIEDENIDTVLPEWAKTSLTNEELEEVIDTHFPKWYTYSVYNTETEASSEWEYTYPEDLSHTLLLPIHATMASREITSSWIEDGMIYTLTNITLQDDTEVSVLYIVNPETLDLVAANVENGNEITNYQFVY